MREAELISEVRVPGHVMHSLGEYPGVVPGEGEITAELYELPRPGVLGVLDEVEGLGLDPPAYRRELVDVGGAPAWMYIYNGDLAGRDRVDSGDWLNR